MTDAIAPATKSVAAPVVVDRPRVGFLGVGWIGRHRMEAVLATGAVAAVGLADPSPEMLAEGLRLAPTATAVDDLDSLLT